VSALLETLLTAFVLSALAAACLALLPQAPPRLRFAIAAAGLAAWLIPWGAIRIVVPADVIPAPLSAPLEATRSVTALAESQLDVVDFLGYVLAGASAFGLALFVGDCVALRRCTRRLRAASHRADGLRSLLPPELAAVAVELRVVADSDVAAASGYSRPTIWIGDRFAGERLRLVVVHEMWHVYARDPLWIASIAAVRRVLWWNPLVAHLARQAMLMIESTCDHRSAAVLEKSRYIGELASLVLAKAAPAPGLFATLQTANFDVQRLRMLGTALRLRARDLVVVAALGVGAATTAMSNVVEQRESAAPRETPPASAQLSTLGRGATLNDAELLDELLGVYAYTPQQHLGEP
jgi:beta-lactamase regulating signal transducer with metallopeptidase domain